MDPTTTPQQRAASLGQLAVLGRLISEVEHGRLRRLVQVRARSPKPVSFARLLLKAGFGNKTIRRCLRLGVDLERVRCDGCGGAVAQANLPPRREVACARCGALILGFAGFRKDAARAGLASSGPWSSSPDSRSSDGESPRPEAGIETQLDPATSTRSRDSQAGVDTLVDPGTATLIHRAVLDLPPELPPLPDLDPPQGEAATSTLPYGGVLTPLPPGPHDAEDVTTVQFGGVIALPVGPRGPRSEDETLMAWSTLVAAPPPWRPGSRAPARGNPADLRTAPMPPPDRPRPAPAGPRIGDWVLLRELGEGGVGKVHLAEHAGTGKRAALKVLKPDVLEDKEYVARFRREAEAAGRLVHPNVAAFVEAGNDARTGQAYIAFEYVAGGCLLDVIAERGTLPDDRALLVVRDVALALGAAEAAGIVHRDVKPENILLEPGGRAKLADLGLIKRDDDGGTKLTQAGIVVGTPCYMAPEQALGEEKLDVRADIYALGLVLWQSLAGSVPFDEDDVLPALEVMTKHIEEDVPDVRLGRPTVSDHTAQVVRFMTARRKEDRYPTPAALVRDIDRVLAGNAPIGPRASAAEGPLPEPAPPPPRPTSRRTTEAGAVRLQQPSERAPAPREASARAQPPAPRPVSGPRAASPGRGTEHVPAARRTSEPLPGTDAVMLPPGALQTGRPPGPPQPASAAGNGAALLLAALVVVLSLGCLATAALLWLRYRG